MSIGSSLAKRYLFVYNVVMASGWTFIFFRLMQAHLTSSRHSVYPAVASALQVFQTGALLEILHCMTGLIRAPVLTTAIQIASRLFLVWGVSHPIAECQTLISFSTMVLAWSLTEMPRYLYFALSSILPQVPYALLYTRYTTFIPLYPLGAVSEFLTLYSAMPFIADTRLFSISLPNRLNFAFDYYIYCVFVLLLYLPGLPFMYSHMIRQRRKYISSPKSSPQKTQ